MRNRKSKLYRITIQTIIISLITAGLFTSCSPETSVPTATSTPQAATETPFDPTRTPTESPTPTPTLPPPGEPGNPVTIGFVVPEDQTDALESVEDLVFLMNEKSMISFISAIYPDFQSLSSDVIDGEVDLFWLEPLEYLYLKEKGAAQVVLMSNHLGVYAYGVQFMTNIEQGFTSYYDVETNQSTGDSITALQQFSGTRPCFIIPDSIPGFLVPSGFLANASTPTLEPVFTYSYTSMIRALFIQGICDFGVSYALIGDPRNASDIIQNLPEAQNKVNVIWQSEGIIPNTNLSVSTELSLDLRYRLQEAFLDLPQDPEGLALLSTALDYDVVALKVVNDSFYDPLREVLTPLNLDLQSVTQP